MDQRTADMAGEPYIGDNPQATSDREQDQASYGMPDTPSYRPDYTTAPPTDPDEYNWAMSGTHVAVSNDDHAALFGAMGWNDLTRPHAFGKLELHTRWAAYWHVEYTNMSIHMVEKKLKRYSKDQGWDFAGLLDETGVPIESQSLKSASVPGIRKAAITYWHVAPKHARKKIQSGGMPVGTYLFVNEDQADEWWDDQNNGLDMPSDIWMIQGRVAVEENEGWFGTYLTTQPISSDQLTLVGQPRTSSVPGIGEINPGVKDWKNKEWSGMEMYDNPGYEQSDTPFYGFQDYDEDVDMSAPRTCTECGQLLLDYEDWRKHILREHLNPERKPSVEPQPVVDLDDVLPAGFNEAIMDKTVQRQSRLIFQLTAEKPRNFIAASQRHWHMAPQSARESIMQNGLDWKTGGGITDQVQEPGNYLFPDPLDPRDEKWWGEEMQHLYGEPYDVWSVDTTGLNVRPSPDGVGEFVTERIEPTRLSLRGQKTSSPSKPPQIPGPMPFIYDIESDRIFVGHPGERHSDIKGRFTPGGIIEGLYDPKGNVQIRTDTDMPYTVRHMAELWYALHPELQIKSIYLMVGTRKYRLASANIGHQVRNLAATDPTAWAVFKKLEAAGGNVYVVGGAVRDIVLGKTPKDIDLMVQGVDAEDVQQALESLPGRVDYTGKQFGVFRYRDPQGSEVEIALPRTERSTGAGHRDFEVVTNPYISVGEDLGRRDFTGNAMAVNLSTGDLVDPYHGSEDLKSGVLRTVSDRSFLEDPLRILRAFGAISRHGLDPDPSTYHDLAAHAHTLGEIPKERLQAELDKLMAGDDPAKAIDLMEATGVLQHALPDVAATSGFDQKSKYHQLNLGDHIKQVLRLTAQKTNDVDVRWAALLHDIGKPGSQWFDEEGYGHFYKNDKGDGEDHEELGAQIAEKLLTELRFPNDRIQRIVHLVRHHMFPPFSAPQGARKFINRVGDEHADDLLTLRWADSGGKDTGNPTDGSVGVMGQLVNGVREAREPTNVSQIAINGNDLIQAGFKPGPEMGQLLRYLTDMVIEDPAINDRDSLLNLAREAYSNPQVDLESSKRIANILDPIKDELDPDVFNHPDSVSPTVKPMIVNWVKRKVYKTMIDAGWPDPTKYLKLILTGSLTTYQWGEESDFDISLWIDVERFPEWVRADLIAMMIEHCDGTIVPGTTHPIQCFVVDVERFSPTDLYKPGLRSAYSLDDGDWVVLPEKSRTIDVSKRWPEHIAYARGVVDKMKMMLRYDKYAVKTYWDFLHWQRHRDMVAGHGDYSLSNIAYKMMANEGLFPHIADATGEYLA